MMKLMMYKDKDKNNKNNIINYNNNTRYIVGSFAEKQRGKGRENSRKSTAIVLMTVNGNKQTQNQKFGHYLTISHRRRREYWRVVTETKSR